jgi:hypothetical protein
MAAAAHNVSVAKAAVERVMRSLERDQYVRAPSR